MSVRAYRINKIEREQNPSFNLWHDNELMNKIQGDLVGGNDEGNGIREISVRMLKEALPICDDDTRKGLEADIKWAEKRGNDYIQYYCF